MSPLSKAAFFHKFRFFFYFPHFFERRHLRRTAQTISTSPLGEKWRLRGRELLCWAHLDLGGWVQSCQMWRHSSRQTGIFQTSKKTNNLRQSLIVAKWIGANLFLKNLEVDCCDNGKWCMMHSLSELLNKTRKIFSLSLGFMIRSCFLYSIEGNDDK